LLDGADVRYLTLGGMEIVRRIHVSVRDQSWKTIPADVTSMHVESSSDSFTVRVSARHRSDDLDVVWDGVMTGEADGSISYAVEVEALRDLLHNRIGLCVLQPWREIAGRRFDGVGPDGPVAGVFPALIAPQRIEQGAFIPFFAPVSRLRVDLPSGEVAFEFEGDVFEAEDQRNWGDASFKLYCAPLSVPRPMTLKRGERLAQSVTVRVGGVASGAAPPPRLAVGAATGAQIPSVGLGGPTRDLAAGERELLSALRPAHLRYELRTSVEWRPALARTLEACADLGAALELALFVRPPDEARLADIRAVLAATGVDVARVLVAVDGARSGTAEETTPGELVRAVRRALDLSGVPVAGGTDLDFCSLNRSRPTIDDVDALFWSINAQVHASDDLSVLETADALGAQVRTAAAFASGKPLFVGPVTLKPRTASDPADPRQLSPVGAAWTLASAKHLAESGVSAITFYEATGPLGVVAGEHAFPLYHVLDDLCELRGASVVACESSRPLEVVGLGVERDDSVTLIAANLTARRLAVDVDGLGDVRRLELDPYEIVRVVR